ncbi:MULTISPECIES: TRAP transporter substrate-binding protein DctP [Hydrogenophaga]|uniref:TRAP transporter substrate-binding protein DctP n=2 Tax=Hydrogenophaga TaxID=47420 RepID=A0ABW2QKB8_9BURK
MKPTLSRLTGALALSLALSTWAHAYTTEDWFAGKVPAAQPKVTYDGAPVKLRFSSPNPAASLVPTVWHRGFEWLGKATNGKLVIEEFHGGTLHAAADGWRAVRNGVTEHATCYTSYEASGFPLHKAIEVPFVTPENPVVATRVIQELAPKYFTKEWQARGVLYGYTAVAGVSDIMSKKPIRKPEDLKGLRVIAQGFSPEAAAALGMVTLNIPFPEIYTAMQQGVADAVIWVDPGFVPFKIYELAKYHTTLGLTAQHVDTCINRNAYQNLPAALKPAFAHFQQLMGHAVSQGIGVDFRTKAKEIYRQNGVTLITLTPEEKAAWVATLKPVQDKWVADQKAAGVPADALLADIRRLEAKYRNATPDELFKLTVEQPVAGLLPQ